MLSKETPDCMSASSNNSSAKLVFYYLAAGFGTQVPVSHTKAKCRKDIDILLQLPDEAVNYAKVAI
jgi:hypothetical protein